MDTKDQHINQFLIAIATELLRYKTLLKILIDRHFADPFARRFGDVKACKWTQYWVQHIGEYRPNR